MTVFLLDVILELCLLLFFCLGFENLRMKFYEFCSQNKGKFICKHFFKISPSTGKNSLGLTVV